MTNKPVSNTRKRPKLAYKLIFIFSFIYYAITAIGFFLALVYNEFLTSLANQYLDGFSFSQFGFFLLIFILFGVYLLLLAGLILLYNNHYRLGLIFFLTGSVIILAVQASIINEAGFHKFYMDLFMLVLVVLVHWYRLKKPSSSRAIEK